MKEDLQMKSSLGDAQSFGVDQVTLDLFTSEGAPDFSGSTPEQHIVASMPAACSGWAEDGAQGLELPL